MAKLKGGIHGKLSGKVGNIIFYSVDEEQYARIKPAAPKKFSGKQLGNQSRFGSMQGWLTPIGEFLKVGCKNNIKFKAGHALALEYLSANAISGEGQDKIIHPELVRVSIGDLAGATDASVTLDGQEAVFSWNPAAGPSASVFDQALILAYDPGQKKACFLTDGFFRKQGSARLPIAQPGEYHCYLGFVAQDRSRQSNSQYLGLVNI